MIKTENRDAVQRLVLHLSSRETAVFKEKMAAMGNRTASQYLGLFDLLKSGKQLSSEQLCTRLQISSKSRLSTLRRNLLEELLEILAACNRDSDINLHLHYLQSQIEILLSQASFSEAEKRCDRALQLAEQYGKYQQLSDLLLLKNNIIQNINYKKYQAVNEIILDKIQRFISFQFILKRISVIYEQVKILSYRTWLPVGKEELSDIADKKRLLDQLTSEKDFEKAIQEPLIKLYFHCTLATCFYMTHEKEACTYSCKLLIEEWKTAPHLIDTYPALFISSVNTSCYNNFFMNDLKHTKDQLSVYSHLSEKYLSSDFYQRIFAIIHFNTELKLHHKTARYDLVERLLREESRKVMAISDQLAPPDALSIPTSIYISYFVLEQWDEAESLLLNVKERSRTMGREDILFFSLIFHLLILYEKKEWYRLDAIIETTYHFLYGRKKLRVFEREMILFIKQISRFREPASQRSICISFLKKLNKMTEGQIPLYSMYFNFPGWIESKAGGLGYMEYVKARNAEKNWKHDH